MAGPNVTEKQSNPLGDPGAVLVKQGSELSSLEEELEGFEQFHSCHCLNKLYLIVIYSSQWFEKELLQHWNIYKVNRRKYIPSLCIYCWGIQWKIYCHLPQEIQIYDVKCMQNICNHFRHCHKNLIFWYMCLDTQKETDFLKMYYVLVGT